MSDAAARASEVLDRKSEYARRRAAAFSQGAEGERRTAQELAELTPDGWLVLHDRLTLEGGNIDHLLVGPGGVVVVDSKSWTGAVDITSDGVLRVAGRAKARDVAALNSASAAVRRVVDAAAPGVDVRSVLSLTQQSPPNGATRLAAGPLVVGVEGLAAAIRLLPETVRGSQLDQIVAALLTAFPSADRTLQDSLEKDAPKPVRELFLRANVFLFVEPWARSGHRRLYLNDDDGNGLGYKDLISGEITVTADGEAAVVNGVLRDAHVGGLSLSRSALPKIPPRLPGGKVLGHLGRMWCNLIVGQHWRKGARNRLYVTLASHDQGIFDLGHIDLDNGLLHPTSNEPLAKDLGLPKRYLEVVADRYPAR